MNLSSLFMKNRLPAPRLSKRYGKEHETFTLLCPNCGTPITTIAYSFNSATKETIRHKLEDMLNYSVTCTGCEKMISAKDIIAKELN